MIWENGGGSVLYYIGQGYDISAKWLNSQTLEITHNRNISFTMKKNAAFFCGDEVKIIYTAQ